MLPNSVGCFYDYGPGYEDPLGKSICNITKNIYGNEGLHKNTHEPDKDIHHTVSGGICTCADGDTYLVGESTSGNLACLFGHDGGVTV